MLGKVISEKQRDWDEWLPLVMTAYRASPHAATGFSPNMLTFGREVSMPIDIVLGRPEDQAQRDTSYESFADNLVAKLEAAYTLVREELRIAAERRKKQYDLRVREKGFETGTWVWYYCPRRYQKRSPKWQRMYSGPFLVVKRIPPLNYVIQRSKHSLPKVVHADKLRAWLGEPLPSWLESKETERTITAEGKEEARTQPKRRAQRAESPEQVPDSVESLDGDQSEVEAPRARPARVRKQPRKFEGYAM
jgi:hypothetical protein